MANPTFPTFSFRTRCPRCRSTKLFRLHREGWLRRIPLAKLYSCQRCRKHFFTISTTSSQSEVE